MTKNGLGQAISTTETRLRFAQDEYERTCRRMAEDFSREGGPAWSSSINEDWRTLRERVVRYQEQLEILKSLEEA